MTLEKGVSVRRDHGRLGGKEGWGIHLLKRGGGRGEKHFRLMGRTDFKIQKGGRRVKDAREKTGLSISYS